MARHDSDQQSRMYVGIGVGAYKHGDMFDPLPKAVPDVEAVRDLLETHGYRSSVICDPTTNVLITRLHELESGLLPGALANGGALVVLWSGHGEPSSEGKLHLIAGDSRRGGTPLMTSDSLAGMAARTGAGQILLILDTCYSGAGALPAVTVADSVLRELPPAGNRVWFGVVASAMDLQRARDGVFGARLLKLLREGPEDPELQLRWSAHNAGVRGDDLIDALLKEWDVPDQAPKFAATGSAWAMFRNPCYNPEAPERIVEHLLLAARGVEPGEEGFYFTGRAAQIERIDRWLRDGDPGVFVVTGPAGSGKSAIVGRVVSLSNPGERKRILDRGPLEHADPGENSVHAHVHARGLTAELLVESIDAQLVRRGVLPRNPAGPRNRGDLYGAIRRSGRKPVIAVDGLDEARSEAWRIADDVIRILADVGLLLVSTRDLPEPTGGLPLVQTLGAREVVDLGAEALREQTRADVGRYVVRRLSDDAGSPAMDPAGVGEAVVRIAGEQHNGDQREGMFLLARVITAQLRITAIDTSQSGWENLLDRSVEAAFERELSLMPPLNRGGEPLPHAARELLTALAWSYGSGLPDDLWPLVATALSPSKTSYERSDVFRLLGEAGRYVVEGGEDGRAVYRPAHQRLVDHLRPGAGAFPGPKAEESSSAVAVAGALVHHYLQLLTAGHSPRSQTYLWRYTWRHCADAGGPGIDLLRKLVERNGNEFLPDLATALSNLGVRYSEMGRRHEAVAPTEEAVNTYRELAAANPAFLPDLARALNNLGVRYTEVGRSGEIDSQWNCALHRLCSPEDRAFLLLRRAEARDSEDPAR